MHEHEHHHHHECDDPNCDCHHHGHEHHHHHADDVFTSWGVETTKKYTKEELVHALTAIQHEEEYGVVLRAKGIVAGENAWLHFDYVPGEPDVREGSAGVTGRLCVIGCKLNETALSKLYNRAICPWRTNSLMGSPPTLLVGLSGYTTPFFSSKARSSSYNVSYSLSDTVGLSNT